MSETFEATSEFEFRPRRTYRIRHHIITPQSHSRVSLQTYEHACPTPITIKLSHHHSLRGPNQTTVSKPTKIKFPAHNLRNLNIKNTPTRPITKATPDPSLWFLPSRSLPRCRPYTHSRSTNRSLCRRQRPYYNISNLFAASKRTLLLPINQSLRSSKRPHVTSLQPLPHV